MKSLAVLAVVLLLIVVTFATPILNPAGAKTYTIKRNQLWQQNIQCWDVTPGHSVGDITNTGGARPGMSLALNSTCAVNGGICKTLKWTPTSTSIATTYTVECTHTGSGADPSEIATGSYTINLIA